MHLILYIYVYMAYLNHKTTLLLSHEDHQLLMHEARTKGKTMGEMIRQAIRVVYRPSLTSKNKKAWTRLFKSKAPVADWETMEGEIVKGRLSQ